MEKINENLIGNCIFRHLKPHTKNGLKKDLQRVFSVSALLGVPELSLAAISGSHRTGQGRTRLCLGLAPLRYWLGLSAANITETKVSENVSGGVVLGFFPYQLLHLFVKNYIF